MADVLPDPLVTMLERLKLTALRDRIDNLLDDAGRQDMTLRECLALLLGSEIAQAACVVMLRSGSLSAASIWAKASTCTAAIDSRPLLPASNATPEW